MVLADGEMGSTQEELQDGPLWEEMKEGFRLFGLDPDTHVHDWVELEPDLGRRPRYFAQLKSFQAPEAQRVCLPHPWAFLVGEAAQLTNPWPGRALNACVKSAQLLSQHLKAVAQAIRAGYPIDESFSRDYGETLTRIQGQEESVHRRQCQAEQKSGWSLSTCLQNAMDASEPGDKAAFRRALKKSHQRLRESGHPEVDLAQTWKRLEGQLSARTLALFRASGSWLFDPPPREEQTETETAKEEPEMDEEKWKEMQAAARGAYNRGVRHLKSKDPIPAARSFRSAAEKGHSKAAYALGVMLLNGQGVKKDERAAAQFMNQAAQSGHVKAMYNLGLMLQHGIGLARDVEKASQWTLRAAEGGHRKALRSGNVKIFGAGPWLDYDPKEMGVERIVKEASPSFGFVSSRVIAAGRFQWIWARLDMASNAPEIGYCRGVHYTVDAAVRPFISCICECDSCKRAHASPLYWAIYTQGAVEVTKGKELVQKYCHEGNLERSFCSRCGTKLWNRIVGREEMGLGTFHPEFQGKGLPETFRPTIHFHSDESMLASVGDLDKLKKRMYKNASHAREETCARHARSD
ncbi:unnamed protein product [Effrenium voratum]|nr:unnamed protein product [Effrenium voratum]